MMLFKHRGGCLRSGRQLKSWGGECKNALLHTMICFRGITYYYDSVKHVEFADFFIKQETQLQTRGHLY